MASAGKIARGKGGGRVEGTGKQRHMLEGVCGRQRRQ